MAAITYKLPPGSWDSHVHVVDEDRFPFSPNRPYTPKKADLDDLLRFEGGLGIDHVCLIAMSVYETDNRSLLDALRRLNGKGRAVVCIDPKTITEAEMDEMHQLGARGVRMNLKTFGRVPDKEALRAEVRAHADKLRSRQWVLQIFVGLGQYPAIADLIPQLGVPVVVDHLGYPSETAEVAEQSGHKEILESLRKGHIWIKLSGTYRFPKTPGVEAYVQEVIRAAPDKVVWASDWPHSGSVEQNPGGDRLKHQDYRKPDVPGFLKQCIDWCGGDQGLIKKIWVDNPRRLWQYNADD